MSLSRRVTHPPNQPEQGNRNRTTKATEVNDVSSRSHAICQIVLRARESGRMYGKLSLVDLAGAVCEMWSWDGMDRRVVRVLCPSFPF